MAVRTRLMPAVHFEWTITFGNVLGALMSLIGVVAAAVKLYLKLDHCLHRIEQETEVRVIRLHSENGNRFTSLTGKVEQLESKVDDLWEWFIRGRRPSR